MKITCIIPTRGDRPNFVAQANHLIERQTYQPDDVMIIQSTNGITGNYQRGIQNIKDGLIICWEDDDYYPKDYIERIVERYDGSDLMGFESTIYYHIKQRKYKEMIHPGRSSMFQTIIKAGIKIKYPEDSEPFLDLRLWQDKNHSRQLISGPSLAIGIKHGMGKTIGAGHRLNFPYDKDDQDLLALRMMTDNDPFYTNLAES